MSRRLGFLKRFFKTVVITFCLPLLESLCLLASCFRASIHDRKVGIYFPLKIFKQFSGANPGIPGVIYPASF